MAVITQLTRILEAGDYVRDGVPADGFINAENVGSSAAYDLRYRDLLIPTSSSSDFVVDAIYEFPSDVPGLPGSTCVTFKFLQVPDPETIRGLRQRIWNQGRSPALCIVTPETVLLYNSFARPE